MVFVEICKDRLPTVKLILFLIAWLVSVSTNAQETSETTNRPNSNNMSDSEFLKLAPEGVTVFPYLAYREGNEAWKLDLAMPTDRGKNAFPVIVYIHGGG